MKEIKAIIQPFMVKHVLDALAAIPELPGVTISHVHGWGKTRAASVRQPIHESGHAFAKKTKIEIVLSDHLVDQTLDLIERTAHTGNVGDGKIFVVDVAETVKIRTGQRGDDAV